VKRQLEVRTAEWCRYRRRRHRAPQAPRRLTWPGLLRLLAAPTSSTQAKHKTLSRFGLRSLRSAMCRFGAEGPVAKASGPIALTGERAPASVGPSRRSESRFQPVRASAHRQAPGGGRCVDVEPKLRTRRQQQQFEAAPETSSTTHTSSATRRSPSTAAASERDRPSVTSARAATRSTRRRISSSRSTPRACAASATTERSIRRAISELAPASGPRPSDTARCCRMRPNRPRSGTSSRAGHRSPR